MTQTQRKEVKPLVSDVQVHDFGCHVPRHEQLYVGPVVTQTNSDSKRNHQYRSYTLLSSPSCRPKCSDF